MFTNRQILTAALATLSLSVPAMGESIAPSQACDSVPSGNKIAAFRILGQPILGHEGPLDLHIAAAWLSPGGEMLGYGVGYGGGSVSTDFYAPSEVIGLEASGISYPATYMRTDMERFISSLVAFGEPPSNEAIPVIALYGAHANGASGEPATVCDVQLGDEEGDLAELWARTEEGEIISVTLGSVEINLATS